MSFWTGRRVFVTGGTGFLGQALVRELGRRRADVTALVRDVTPRAPFFRDGLDRQVTLVPGSVEHYDVLERALGEYQVDTVLHLAAQAIVPVANQAPLATFETNIRGTWNLLEACRRSRTVSRVVVASSDKAYGAHDVLPYQESHPLQGKHPYDVSKSCADLLTVAYHHTYGLPASLTRCGNLFGPGDINYSRLVPGTIRAALCGERPVIRSDGRPVRDYLFVEDAVAGYLVLAERLDDPAVRGQAFNFGTGEPVSVLELTRRILELTGRLDLQPDIRDEAKAEIERQFLSGRRAETVLGWRPARPLGERLHETVEWYRRHLAAEAP